MKKISIIIISLLLFIFINRAHSTVYYVSNSGNDSNNGISPVYPIKSIAKINAVIYKMKPGDVMLFERGSVFYGQISISSSGNDNASIVFGAYGKGKNPVINGSIPIRNWVNYKDNIFTSNVNADVKNFYTNNKQMILARYPNTGYLTISKPFQNGNKGFTDYKLKQSKGYWEGSNVRLRTVNWAYEHTPVQSFNKGSITFSNPTLYPAQAGWGYYLDNNLFELDVENEWYFKNTDSAKGVMYFIPPDNKDANSVFTEGSIYAYGFYSYKNISNVIIRDLSFINQYDTGIFFTGNLSEVKIINCTFAGQVKGGLSFGKSSYKSEITNCRFSNINGRSIYALNFTNGIISENVIRNAGMIPGYGTTSDPRGMSSMVIVFKSNSNNISYNYIYNIGHDGINCNGSSNVIEKNLIQNVMLNLNDGGGIKCYGEDNTNSVRRNNFIINAQGNSEGTVEPYSRIVVTGIYLDEHSSDMQVLDNTITQCGESGVFLYNNCNNNLISGNVSYDNPLGIIIFKTELPMSGNLISENIFFGLNSEQLSVNLKAPKRGFVPGKFENNYYCNPGSDKLFVYQTGNILKSYDFAQWKSIVGNNEINSQVISGEEADHSKLFSNMSDDTLNILLQSGINFKDLSMNDVYGSVNIPPWKSKILLTNSDISSYPEIMTYGKNMNFDFEDEEKNSNLKWFGLVCKNLSSGVTVTAPEGFEVSLKEDIDFKDRLYLNQENGKVDAVVFVRSVYPGEKNYYGFITAESGSVVKNVKVKSN